MAVTLNGSASLPLVDAYGRPLPARRRGRPRKDAANAEAALRTDPELEYTATRSSRYNSLGAAAGGISRLSPYYDLEKLYGNVDDLDLTLGWDAKRQMMNDSHVGSAIDTLLIGALARPAEIEPTPESFYTDEADKGRAIETAEFARRCFHYLKLAHRDITLTAFTLGRAMMVIGHSKAEVVRENKTDGIDAGKSVLNRIKPKSRRNSCFVVDRQNNVVGIAGYVGDYSNYNDPFSNQSMSLRGALPFGELGRDWQLIERDHWLVMIHKGDDDDSPLGESALRRAYAAYRMKRDAWAYYLKALDFAALPFIWIEGPEQQYAQDTWPLVDGKPNTSADKVPIGDALFDAVEYARQGGVAYGPHSWKVNAIHNDLAGDPHGIAIERFNAEITMAILLQMLSTKDSRHMARAAGQVHQDILDLAMRYVRRLIAESITRDVLFPLIRDNFPATHHHLVPRCTFGEVELNDFLAWATAFEKIYRSGIGLSSQLPAVWAQLGMPQGDANELAALVERDRMLLERAAEPPDEDEDEPDGEGGQSKEPGSKAGMLGRHAIQEVSKRVTRDAGVARASRSGGLR